MNGRAIKWGRGHTDKYVFDVATRMWEKVSCSLQNGGRYDRMNCTAPKRIPSNEMASYHPYNCRLTEEEIYAAC